MSKKIQYKRNGNSWNVYADGRKTHFIKRDKDFEVYSNQPQLYMTGFLTLKAAKAFIKSEINGESIQSNQER